MSDVRSILERGVGGAAPPPDGFERMLRRRDRKRRRQRVGAQAVGLVIAVAIAIVALQVVRTGRQPARPTPPPPPGSSVVTAHDSSFLDLRSGALAPLPGALNEDGRASNFQVSPDGAQVLFDTSDVGSLLRPPASRVYVANIDGSGGRAVGSVLHIQTFAGTWSPDGTRVAFINGWEDRADLGLFVVPAGQARPVNATDALTRGLPGSFDRPPAPRFSPDGEAILYTSEGPDQRPAVSSIPSAGGQSRVVEADAGLGSYSPDGRRLLYLEFDPDASAEAEEWRFGALHVARTDGTADRIWADGPVANAAWSPDGNRIAFEQVDDAEEPVIVVLDLATGETEVVAQGLQPTWVDGRTLIVEGLDG